MYRTELKGRIAVVLGGADGVGAAVCRLLAARGARIAVIGDDEAELQDLVDELRWVGADAVGIVSTGGDTASVHAGVLSEVGPPDLALVPVPLGVVVLRHRRIGMHAPRQPDRVRVWDYACRP